MIRSHSAESVDFETKVAEIRQRLIAAGDTSVGPLSEKLEFVKQLSEFEYGRYYLVNGGLNGKWSHYAFYEFPKLKQEGRTFSPLEMKMLNGKVICSHAERLKISHRLLKSELFEGISILSVPCGVMAELATMDYSGLKDFRLTGVDADQESIELAKSFAAQNGLTNHCRFLTRDAWKLDLSGEFDVALSLGLNIYSPSLDVAMGLYRSLHSALKKGGKLIVTYLTPDFGSPDCERDPTGVTPEMIRFAKLLNEVIQPKNNNYKCTTPQIKEHLSQAGFSQITCHFSSFRAANIALAVK